MPQTRRLLSICFSTLVVLNVGYQSASAESVLSARWQTAAVFLEPESAVIDPVREVIYVSNVNQYAEDGNGFVSRVSFDGKTVDLEWLSGLNSPTGVTIFDDLLYVVDYNRLVVVDLKTETIVASYPAPEEKPALNDVVASDHGVFVSGSLSNSIYNFCKSKGTHCNTLINKLETYSLSSK